MYNICIEVPKGNMIKRDQFGSIDYISPIPCPFNYGSVLDVEGEDGDLQDAILLGKRKKIGFCGTYSCIAKVLFFDAGKKDHKWVFSEHQKIRKRELILLEMFFHIYAKTKHIKHRLCFETNKSKQKTSFEGIIFLIILISIFHFNFLENQL